MPKVEPRQHPERQHWTEAETAQWNQIRELLALRYVHTRKVKSTNPDEVGETKALYNARYYARRDLLDIIQCFRQAGVTITTPVQKELDFNNGNDN